MAVSIAKWMRKNGTEKQVLEIYNDGDRYPMRIGPGKAKKILANADEIAAKLKEMGAI